ncbi:TNF receptor-associated factor 1-like [Thamnophis elegans]|uniref:TNF receptor-associated factor 1-like n=1 Tax=Thamnophis elegans TaxID=35005 RepID=UPI00137761C8|nr:TNF receptor-associated factor 1-like [Thamnophis elegans]
MGMNRLESKLAGLTLHDLCLLVDFHSLQMPGGQVEGIVPSQHPLLCNTLPQFVGLDFPLDHLLEQIRPDLKIRQQVAELESRQKTLENIVSVLSRELARKEVSPDVRIGEALARILCLEEKSGGRTARFTLGSERCDDQQLGVPDPGPGTHQLRWVFPLEGPQGGASNAGSSNRQTACPLFPPIYTARYGYKLCLKLFLNGDGAGAGTHLSLFLVVMKGEYDFQLKWPFQHKVTFTLLDQVNNCHISTVFRSLESSCSFQRPINETNVASGVPEFYPLNSLHEPGAGYLHNDMLAIQAVIDTKA